MPFFKCQNIKIKAVACAVPDDVEYTEEYAKLFDKAYVDKFIKSTGVKRRYASHRNGVTASDLCYASAEKILTEMDYDRDKIDALIYASSSPDYAAPVTACVLQDRLGLSRDFYLSTAKDPSQPTGSVPFLVIYPEDVIEKSTRVADTRKTA